MKCMVQVHDEGNNMIAVEILLPDEVTKGQARYRRRALGVLYSTMSSSQDEKTLVYALPST